MNVTFYKFSKKLNSTARPSGGTQYSIRLKDECSQTNPVLICDFGKSESPEYNYCYIPEFSRYYFLKNWSFNKGLWFGEFVVDSLASWKNTIGSTDFYVLRSASDCDIYVEDNKYPARSEIISDETTIEMPWVSPANGYTVVSFIASPVNYGGLAYRVFSYSELKEFIEGVFTGIKNPIDYIRTAMWFPYKPFCEENASTIHAGSPLVMEWNPVAGHNMTSSYQTFHYTMPIPAKTEVAGATWKYKYPFCNYTLDINPWGVISLDSNILCERATIDIDIRSDNITGNALLRVTAGDDVLYNGTTQLGVTTNISGNYTDFSKLLGAVGGIAGAIATGGATLPAIGFAGAAVGSGLSSFSQPSSSSGATGGFSSIFYSAKLVRHRLSPVDEDITRNGRPLCKVKKPSELSGFIQVEKGDISIPATLEEMTTIKNYLEGGFYYE